MRQVNMSLHRTRVTEFNRLRKKGLTLVQAAKKLKIAPSQFYSSLKQVRSYKPKKRKARH